MLKPNEDELRAMVRLEGNRDFQTFIAFIERCEMEAMDKLVTMLDEVQLRQQQGVCKTLRSIREYAIQADDMLRKTTQAKARTP